MFLGGDLLAHKDSICKLPRAVMKFQAFCEWLRFTVFKDQHFASLEWEMQDDAD
jgi:hypothetical protein